MKKLILLLIAGGLLNSCKKKNDPAQPETIAAAISGYHGLFIAEQYVIFQVPTKLFMANVVLHSKATPASALLVLGEDLGAVKSNGINLAFQSGLRMYLDTSAKLNYSKEIKFEHISPDLGNINFINTDPFIEYPETLATTIEDTLDNTKDYVIPLNGITGFDAATCLIKDPFNPKIISKTVGSGATAIVFKPADLSELPSGIQHSVRVVLINYNDQSIDGKYFRFENDSYLDLGTFVK